MFYLTEFFKSLGESLIRGFSFFLFSCLLAFSLTHRPWIAEVVEKISPQKIVNPYFVAVMDEQVDASKLKTLITRLPGVLSITDKTSEESQGKLNQLVSQLGTDYSVSADLMNFKSVRIALNPSLSQESLDFVREQVVKFGGKEHLTATDVKYPEVTSVMRAHPFYHFLEKAGDWGIIGILAICWIVSFWLCYDLFRSRSYLIEKFQRKKLVASKTIAVGLSLVVIAFCGLGLLNGTLKFFDTIVLLMVFSIFWTFSMQEWRWKSIL
jgi:predicted small integral membrane protein